MKVQVSHRLDEELLAWATEYGESRRSSRAVVIEEALRVFRDLCSTGVADLPDDAVAEEPAPRPVIGVTTARQLLERGVGVEASARQRRLNESAARARSVKRGKRS
jgi:hypothetical protein